MIYDNDIVISRKIDDIYVLQFKKLLEYEDKVKHFFTLKHGGNSINEYSSLNLGYYTLEDKEIIKKNYIDVCNKLNINYINLFIPKQIHSDKSIYVDLENCGTIEKQNFIECDGGFTNIKDIPLVSNCADCMTVLIYDKVNNYIASVHSGWKGVVNNIVNKTINTMVDKYGCKKNSMIVCIGPSICKDCFEIKKDVYDIFYNLYSKYEDVFIKKDIDRYNIDLTKLLSNMLIDNGILEENIQIANICNKCNVKDFYSYRENKITGRMGHFIMLR